MMKKFGKYFLIMVGLILTSCEQPPPSPDLADDEASVMINSSVDIDVIINDRKQPLLVVVSSHPVHGTAYEMGNGIIRYTPEFNYVGQDHFYYVDDTDLNGAAAKVTITVLPLDEPEPDPHPQPPVGIPND